MKTNLEEKMWFIPGSIVCGKSQHTQAVSDQQKTTGQLPSTGTDRFAQYQ